MSGAKRAPVACQDSASRAGRVLTGAATAAVLLLGTGCGVPTSSRVETVGPGPEGESPGVSAGSRPPHENAAETPDDQVDNFLQAAAGNPDTAADRVRSFLREEDRAGWAPGEQIRVVRVQQIFLTEDPAGGQRAELTVQVVGELHPDGYLDAPTETQANYEFRVVPEGTQEVDVRPRWRIADPPPDLLLNATALDNREYFHPHPIYFWDADGDELVPDLRWLPLAGEPTDLHPFVVMRWLLTGPAPSLPRVEALPAGSQQYVPPKWEDGRLIVDLNATAAPEERVNDLATQLARSLLPLREGTTELELLVDRRPVSPNIRRQRTPDRVRFAVLDGVVRGYAEDEPELPEVLSDEINHEVRAAALTDTAAALIRERSDGQLRLSVVRMDDETPREVRTDLVRSEIGQPAWLRTTGDAVGLVVADGRLYRFDTGSGEVTRVMVAGVAGAITAVAVAPERRRLALIADDQLYLASLREDGQSVTVQTPRALPTTAQDLAGVAFTDEISLVVVGTAGGRVGLYELTVDGGVENLAQDLENVSVSRLVAHPYRDSGELGPVLYEAGSQASVYTAPGSPRLIQPGELVGAPEGSDSPPQAPFFLG